MADARPYKHQLFASYHTTMQASRRPVTGGAIKTEEIMKFQNMLTGKWKEAEAWQEALKPGDYFVNEQPIAGIIPEQGQITMFNGLPTIYAKIERLLRTPGMLWCTAYSEWEPRGEQGTQCIVDATRQITKEEFEEAQARGFKS